MKHKYVCGVNWHEMYKLNVPKCRSRFEFEDERNSNSLSTITYAYELYISSPKFTFLNGVFHDVERWCYSLSICINFIPCKEEIPTIIIHLEIWTLCMTCKHHFATFSHIFHIHGRQNISRNQLILYRQFILSCILFIFEI